MIYAFKKPIKPFIYFITVFFSVNVKAQVSLLQNTIDKIESYQNFSYQSISKEKELFVSDTVTEQRHAIFEKALHDKNFGYLIQVETIKDRAKYTELYNGQNLICKCPRQHLFNSGYPPIRFSKDITRLPSVDPIPVKIKIIQNCRSQRHNH